MCRAKIFSIFGSFLMKKKVLNNHSRKIFIRKLFPITAVLLICSSCFLPVKGFRESPQPASQTSSSQQPRKSSPPAAEAPDVPRRYKKSGGCYHTVQRGQTIYRISQYYNVPQEVIIEANGIKDVTRLRVGQVLFIPGRRQMASNQGSVPDVPPVRTPPSSAAPSEPPSPPSRIPPPEEPQEEPPAECAPGQLSFIWPLNGELSSTFGMRNGRHHDGIDLRNSIGTPIHAAADGVVIYADRLGGYGLIVILKHEGNLKTVYAHNSRNLVKKGDMVKQGDVIAELGNSGNATGPHLHFEIRCGQKAVDPLVYLPKR